MIRMKAMSGFRKYISFWAGLILLLLSFVALPFYVASGSTYTVFTESQSFDEALQFHNGKDVFRQRISVPEDASSISALMIGLATNARINFGTVNVSLCEDDEVVYQWHLDTRYIEDLTYQTVKFPKPYKVDKEKEYSFVLSEDFMGANNLAVLVTAGEGSGGLTKNGMPVDSRGISYRLAYAASSAAQRTIFAFIVFLTVLTAAVLLFVFEDVVRRKAFRRYSFAALDFCAVIFLLLFTYVFQHYDGKVISYWGYYLIDAAANGNARDYVAYLQEVFKVSDYNILINIFTAVILLPVYLASRIGHLALQVAHYDCWRRLFLVLFTFITSRYIKKIAVCLGAKESSARLLAVFYMISPAVLWGSMAMGQIDCVVVMFMVLSLWCLLRGKYEPAFFWLSVSVSFKQFAFFFLFMPMVCLIIGSAEPKRIARCLLIYLIVPAVSWFLSNIYFYDYAQMASLSERFFWKHMDRLFDASLAETSCFLVVLFTVCFVCLEKSFRKDVKALDYLLAPMVVTTAFQCFIIQNPQWLIYMALFLVLTMFYTEKAEAAVLIQFVFSVSVYVFVCARFPGNVDNTMILGGSVYRMLELENNSFSFMDFAAHYSPYYYEYLARVGKTMLSAASLSGLYVLFRSAKNGMEIREEGGGPVPACAGILATFAVNAAVLLVSLCIYFGMIYY